MRTANLSTLVSVLVLVSMMSPHAGAYTGGVAGYHGPTKTCMSCHPSITPLLTGTLQAPSSIVAGQKYTLTLSCTAPSGGAYPEAGLDAHASCGVLSAAEANTKALGSDLVHSSPKKISAGKLTYSFDWTAPLALKSCAINATGLFSNKDGSTSGDLTCQATATLSVTGISDGGLPDIATAPDAATGDAAGKADSKGAADAGGAADTGARQDSAPAPGDGDDGGCSFAVGSAAAPGHLLLLVGLLLGLVRRRQR